MKVLAILANPFCRVAATLRARSHVAEQKRLAEERQAEQQRMVEFAHG